MASPATGDAPSLRRRQLQNSVEINAARIFEANYPLFQLFSMANNGQPRLVSSSTVSIPLDFDDRRLGNLHSRPSHPDQFLHTRVGQVIASVGFQRYEEEMAPDHVARLHMLNRDISGMTMEMSGRQQALAEIQRIQRKGIRHCMRRQERWCANLLSQSSFTQNVDGHDITVTTNIGTGSASTSWSTPSTDIQGDLARFETEFITQAGRPFTHMIYSYLQGANFGLNTDIRAMAIRANGNAAISALPQYIMSEDMKNATILRYTGSYNDAAGTRQEMWPEDQVTFLALDEGSETLDMVTTGTTADDYNGGIFSKSYVDPKTDGTFVVVGHNGAPILKRVTDIMTFDVS